MATLPLYQQLTLVELANRKDPDGAAAKIAEILNRDNRILDDAPFLEANDTTQYKVVRRFKLPTGEWRQYNSGVGTEASRTITINEPIGMLESYAENDKALIDMFPNPDSARMDEAAAFIEGMGQNFQSTMFYGNGLQNPEQFTGLAPRLASLGDMVKNGGNSGGTSIYVVQWAPDRAFMAYPKGSPNFGVTHRDLGEERVKDSNGKAFQAYVDHFKINGGLVVKDPRCIGRYANINPVRGGANTFDEDILIELIDEFPMDGNGCVIYCNKKVMTQMRIKLKDKANVNFDVDEGLGGRQVLTFMGHAIHKCEAILTTESVVS